MFQVDIEDALEQARPATFMVDALNETGAVEPTSIAGEHPLTLYVDKREIVRLMTLGAACLSASSISTWNTVRTAAAP